MKHLFAVSAILGFAATAPAQINYSTPTSVSVVGSTANFRSASGQSQIFTLAVLGEHNGSVYYLIGGASFTDFVGAFTGSGASLTQTFVTNVDAGDDNGDFRSSGDAGFGAGNTFLFDFQEDAADSIMTVSPTGTLTDNAVTDEALAGIDSIAYIDSDTTAFARGDNNGGDETFGIIDLSVPTITSRGSLAGNDPEIDWNPATSKAYIQQEDGTVLEVTNLLSGTVSTVDATPAGWSGNSFSDFRVGPNGELIAVDTTNSQFRIVQGSTETTLAFNALASFPGITAINPVFTNGIAVAGDSSEVRLYIANFGPQEDNLGDAVVVVTFQGSEPGGTEVWEVK